MRRFLAVLLVCIMPFLSCRTRAVREYEDPGRITFLDLRFNDADLKKFADEMTRSILKHLEKHPIQGKPVIMVGKIDNRTDEHIHMRAITDQIITGLLKTGKVVVVDKTAREVLPKEYEYQRSKYVDPKSAKRPGKQIAPGYLLRGQIWSDIHEDSKLTVKYVRITLRLTDILTNTILWQDQSELRKLERR
jgi:hypothetical protein